MLSSRREGFTLVELLIGLAIASILLGIVYNVFIAQRRGHVVQEQVAEMQQNARIAADELTRAIKGIGYNVDRAKTPPQEKLLYCGPYEILFNSDLDSGAAAATAGTSV